MQPLLAFSHLLEVEAQEQGWWLWEWSRWTLSYHDRGTVMTSQNPHTGRSLEEDRSSYTCPCPDPGNLRVFCVHIVLVVLSLFDRRERVVRHASFHLVLFVLLLFCVRSPVVFGFLQV